MHTILKKCSFISLIFCFVVVFIFVFTACADASSEKEVFDPSYKIVDRHLIDILKTGSTTYTEEEISDSFNPAVLKWENNKISLSPAEWEKFDSLMRILYYDDGDGFLDLGVDPDFDIVDNDLVNTFDGTALGIDNQLISYYYLYTWEEADKYLIRGYTPAMLNGNIMFIILDFTDSHPYGEITMAVDTVYDQKTFDSGNYDYTTVKEGDHVQFLCKYITYEGNEYEYYKLGEEIILGDTIDIANSPIDVSRVRLLYQFIDTEGNVYWTPLADVKQ